MKLLSTLMGQWTLINQGTDLNVLDWMFYDIWKSSYDTILRVSNGHLENLEMSGSFNARRKSPRIDRRFYWVKFIFSQSEHPNLENCLGIMTCVTSIDDYAKDMVHFVVFGTVQCTINFSVLQTEEFMSHLIFN